MAIGTQDIRGDQNVQDFIFEALSSGKKVIFRFVNNEDKAAFMDELGKIGGAIGGAFGIIAGSVGSYLLFNAMVSGGVYILGDSAVAAIIMVGAVSGLTLGSLLGYSLGAWGLIDGILFAK